MGLWADCPTHFSFISQIIGQEGRAYTEVFNLIQLVNEMLCVTKKYGQNTWQSLRVLVNNSRLEPIESPNNVSQRHILQAGH